MTSYRHGMFKRFNPQIDLSFPVEMPQNSQPAQRHVQCKDPVSPLQHRPCCPCTPSPHRPGSCSSAAAWFHSAMLGSLERTPKTQVGSPLLLCLGSAISASKFSSPFPAGSGDPRSGFEQQQRSNCLGVLWKSQPQAIQCTLTAACCPLPSGRCSIPVTD